MKLEQEFTLDEMCWDRAKLMALYYKWIKVGGMPGIRLKVIFEDNQ